MTLFPHSAASTPGGMWHCQLGPHRRRRLNRSSATSSAERKGRPRLRPASRGRAAKIALTEGARTLDRSDDPHFNSSRSTTTPGCSAPSPWLWPHPTHSARPTAGRAAEALGVARRPSFHGPVLLLVTPPTPAAGRQALRTHLLSWSTWRSLQGTKCWPALRCFWPIAAACCWQRSSPIRLRRP